MIRITLELVSAVNPSRSKVLGVGIIALDPKKAIATGGRRGDYMYTLSMRAPFTNRIWKSGRIEGFPRKRLLGWDLFYRVLRDAIGWRNPDPGDALPIPPIPRWLVPKNKPR